MTTERGNSACCMGGQLTVEPVSESHREAVLALAVRASHQQAICLEAVSLLPLEVSKQSPSDHLRRMF